MNHTNYRLYVIFFLLFSIASLSLFASKKNREQELQQIVNKSDIKGLEKIVKKGADFEKTYCLHSAVNSGNEVVVNFLLDSGIPADSKDNLNSTPLIKACSRSGNKAVVKILLEHGANVNAKNDIFTTPLIAALRIPNNDAVVKLLLDYGADINKPLTDDGKTPLILAVEANNLNTTMLLVNNGADISLKSDNQESAFSIAVENNNIEITEFLLAKNKQLLQNFDLLFFKTCQKIIQNGQIEMFKLFLKNGLQVNTVINAETEDTKWNNYTLLYLAVVYDKLDIVKLLIEYKANPNIESSMEENGSLFVKATPLAYAVHEKRDDAYVDILLSAKADPNCIFKFKLNEIDPLVFAVYSGNLRVCKALLKAGANPNKNYDEHTLLYHARREFNASQEIIDELCKAGAKLTKKEEKDLSYEVYSPGDLKRIREENLFRYDQKINGKIFWIKGGVVSFRNSFFDEYIIHIEDEDFRHGEKYSLDVVIQKNIDGVSLDRLSKIEQGQVIQLLVKGRSSTGYVDATFEENLVKGSGGN